MSSWGVAGGPEVLASPDLADLVEEWLRTQTQPQEPVIWTTEHGRRFVVDDAVQLAARLRALKHPGDWGVVARASGRPWAQSMRVDDGWIVEVDGGTGPQNYAKRVQRIGEPLTDLHRACADVPFRGVSYFGDESFGTPLEAARVLWAWVAGGLPLGYSLRELVEGVD